MLTISCRTAGICAHMHLTRHPDTKMRQGSHELFPAHAPSAAADCCAGASAMSDVWCSGCSTIIGNSDSRQQPSCNRSCSGAAASAAQCMRQHPLAVVQRLCQHGAGSACGAAVPRLYSNTSQSGLCCSMAAATIPVRRCSCRIRGCEAVALVILYEMG